MLRKTIRLSEVRPWRITVLVGIIILCVVSGCESQSESKKLALTRWQKASAYAKLNFAEQQYQNEQFEQALNTAFECVSINPDMPVIISLRPQKFCLCRAEKTMRYSYSSKGWRKYRRRFR